MLSFTGVLYITSPYARLHSCHPNNRFNEVNTVNALAKRTNVMHERMNEVGNVRDSEFYCQGPIHEGVNGAILPFTRVLLMNPWSGVRPVNLLKGQYNFIIKM